MQTIVSYTNTEQRTFAELPFNPVDSLVLSTISYLKLEEGYCGTKPIPRCGDAVYIPFHSTLMDGTRTLLHNIIALSNWDDLATYGWMKDSKERTPFLKALMASRRFRDVEIAYYSDMYSEVIEKQFTAMTFFIPVLNGEIAYLAFRGTDGTLAGWKENFNMCFRDIVPSQQAAAAYLSGVASACTCPLYLGGHSKGGNFAEYASLVTAEEVFDRIIEIYNHDGPSFLDNPTPRILEARYLDKLKKTVPESSIFGMTLERRSNYQIVQSNAISFMQHEPFTWLIADYDFLYQEQLNSSAVFFDEAFDTWLKSKTPAERERFIDTVYELFISTDTSTWSEFYENTFSNVRKVLGSGSKLDPETKSFVLKTFGSFGSILKDKTISRFSPFNTQRTPDQEDQA